MGNRVAGLVAEPLNTTEWYELYREMTCNISSIEMFQSFYISNTQNEGFTKKFTLDCGCIHVCVRNLSFSFLFGTCTL